MLFFDQPGEQCGTAAANALRYNYTGGLMQARFWGFHKVDTQSAGPGDHAAESETESTV